jgi:Putative zinc-finger
VLVTTTEMDVHDLSPKRCMVARQRLSLRIDGELSEPEARLLERHLALCVECTAWAADLEAVATTLQQAPLAKPEREMIALRPRLRLHDYAAVGAAAAGIAVAVLAITVESRSLAVPRPSATAAARGPLNLKERQLTSLGPAPGKTQPRPSLPSGISPPL